MRFLLGVTRFVGRMVGGTLLLAYLLASRSLIMVAALYLVTYFLLGSRPVKDAIQQAVSDAVPGTIGACAVQWGPLPQHVRIAAGRIVGERGEDVIRVRGIEATIDLGATLGSLLAFIRGDTPGIHIHLERVDLLEPWARVEVHDDGWVGLESALVDTRAPDEPPNGEPPFVFEISADVVRVLDASGRVETPGFRLAAEGLNTVTNYALRVAGDFTMDFDVPRTEVRHVDMSFTSFPHVPAPLDVAAQNVVVEDVRWRTLGFEWRHAAGELVADRRSQPAGPVVHARFTGSGGLEAAHEVPSWHGEGVIELAGDAPEVPFLTKDLVRGPLKVAIAGAGTVEQLDASWRVTSPELAIGELIYRELVADGRMSPRGNSAEPRRHAILVDRAEALLGGGRVTLGDFAWGPRTDDAAERDLAFQVRAEDVDVGGALAALFEPAVPLLPAGSWSGEATIETSPRPGGDRLVVDVDGVKIAWEHPPVPGLAANWSVAGRVSRDRGVTRLLEGGPMGPFDDLDVRGLVVDAGADRVRLAGKVDLLSGAIDLEPYARVGDLAPLSRALGLPDLVGRFVVKEARARGNWLEPRIEGTLNWTEARIGARDLGRVNGPVSFSGGTLSFAGVASESNVASFSVDAAFDLVDPGWRPSKNPNFRVKTRELQGLLVSALGPWLGPDARITVTAGEASGSLADPAGTLTGSGHVVVTNASLGGENGLRLEANITAKHTAEATSTILLDRVTITSQNGAVWQGRLRLARPAGTHGFPDSTALEGNFEIGDTSLGNLRPVALGLPDLSGILRGRLTLGGTLGRPAIIGTLELEDAVLGELQLGDALLAVTTRDQVIEISAFDSTIFSGIALERANLTLAGLSPRRFDATLRVHKKDLGELMPVFRDSAVEVNGSAAAEVEIDVPSGDVSFRVKAAARDIVIAVPERSVRWTNESEVLIVSDEGRFRLHPVTLAPAGSAIVVAGGAAAGATRSDTSPRLEACGKVDDKVLDLQLAGAVDLAIVPGLADLFSVSEGRLRIAPDPVAEKAIGDDTCLQNASGMLLLGGSPSAPVAIGTVQTQGLTLVPRGSGRQVRVKSGATIVMRKGQRAGQQRLLLGAEGQRFEGELDDGSFALAGEVVTRALRPQSLDVRLTGADLFIQSAGEFAFTASPNARLLGAELDGPSPSLLVSGDLALSEGRFSKSFDTFARAVGGALGARSGAYTTSLLDDVPWLGKARLDVNVVASDFQIQSALPLARTDLPARLDLTLRGTIAQPRLFRRIDLLPGGTLTYLVFERTFTVSQGAVDFDGDPERPLVEVTAQSQITYLQRAQTTLQEEDEKEVTVTLRMTGRVPDLKIELSSDDPTLDQADIQSLLITGKPRGDLDRAQESRVVSADLANVINTVLSAPFVRTASVGVDQKGGLEYRVGTCFAPNLCFDTTTVSDDSETTLRAKFSLSIGDDVVCEGTLKRSDTGATSAQETYEARCRYRIPLE